MNEKYFSRTAFNKKTKRKSPNKKAIKKETAILKKERAKSEPTPAQEGKNIFNNVTLISQALNDLYRPKE